MVVPCLALLEPALKRPREEAVVRQALEHAPYLLCDEGGFVLARYVVLELLEDQGSRERLAYNYLVNRCRINGKCLGVF